MYSLRDPTDPLNQALIEAKIKASIAAFEDADRGGLDDDPEHDGVAPASDHACTTPPAAT